MLIDSHCHLPHNLEEAGSTLNSAKAEGVDKVITIGTSMEDNQKTIELAESFEDVYAAVGVYPHENLNNDLEILKDSLETTIKLSKKVVGIGECGIDITDWQGGRSVEDQIKLFEMQIELALKHNLPIVIHNRNGDEQILNSLKKYENPGLRGVAHCFTSSWETAKTLIDLNFYISFSGLITYPSRKELQEVVKKVPLDKFLLETDAPYLPPQGYRGERNEPKYVKIVAQKAAEITGVSFEEISKFSYENTCRVFDIK